MGALADIVRFQLEMAFESEGVELDIATVQAGVEAALRDPRLGEYFVARGADGAVMGSLMVTREWSDWHAGDYWWIQSVYVRPEYRGQGVFKALYAEVRRRAVAAGSSSLRLYVDRSNTRAQSTYQRLGMSPSHYLMYEEDLL